MLILKFFKIMDQQNHHLEVILNEVKAIHSEDVATISKLRDDVVRLQNEVDSFKKDKNNEQLSNDQPIASGSVLSEMEDRL